jgi:hypothetical protein
MQVTKFCEEVQDDTFVRLVMKCICYYFNNKARRVGGISCSWNYIYGFKSTNRVGILKARFIFMNYFVKAGCCITSLEENNKWYRHENIIA